MRLNRSSFIRRSALIAFSAVLASSCTDFSSPPDALGHLLVSVKDDTGAGVPGMNVDLLLNDRTTRWAAVLTTANGGGEFRPGDGGVIPQTYIVRFLPTGQYILAADDTNDKPAVVVIGQNLTVNFKVTKKVVGAPG